jgi:hypothetical protein
MKVIGYKENFPTEDVNSLQYTTPITFIVME